MRTNRSHAPFRRPQAYDTHGLCNYLEAYKLPISIDWTLVDPDGGSAWNPGVCPGIPHEFRSLETIFQPKNVFGSVSDVFELGQLTGLAHEELTAFRPQRLALHELIIRVTADIAVAEGDEEEVFGKNFRKTSATIWDKYVLPHIDLAEQAYEDLRREVDLIVREILSTTLFPEASAPARGAFPFSLLRRRSPTEPTIESSEERDHRAMAFFKSAGLSAEDPKRREVFRSLYRIYSAASGAGSCIGSNHELLAKLATVHVCNRYGSQLIGDLITPLIEQAIESEGFVRARKHAAPILISLKGASAAGKSSLRPMLKDLMHDQGIVKEGYVTISPDIWRRLLLDYKGLGVARKYAGYLTSREVALIDGKLDRHIRDKANREQGVPHLMVDRFRFDSFSSEKIPRVLDATYAKYVDTMYMYFVVTPPEETVERGWQRALERGRFKAVEDFLGHCVEAYTGMPKLLFKWLAHLRPTYRYVFLDNRVPRGTFPKIAASGDQHTMTIYDPVTFVNIERYQKINTYAASVDEVYLPPAAMSVANNLNFIKKCIRRIPEIDFVNGHGGVAYFQVRNGKGEIMDADVLKMVVADVESAAIVRAITTFAGCNLPPTISLSDSHLAASPL